MTEVVNVARAATADVARRSYGKLVALLASRYRDIAGAELGPGRQQGSG